MTPGTSVRRKHGINTRLTLLADDFSYEEPSTTKHFNRKRVLQDQGSTVLSENHIRTYWWCNPARIGMATMGPDRWTARCKGASFCNAKCVRA